MDKHQRKQLSRWEHTKAKSIHKFEERMKDNESRREWHKVAIAIQSYTPSQAAVFTKALELLRDPVFHSVRHHYHWPLFVHPGGPFFLLSSRNRWIAPPPPDIEEEVREGRDRKLMQSAVDLMPTLLRHMDRVDTIRGELLVRAHRSRAIQNCLAIKEELMMAAWHPRRVGRILETYGWDALDNLLGVE